MVSKSAKGGRVEPSLDKNNVLRNFCNLNLCKVKKDEEISSPFSRHAFIFSQANYFFAIESFFVNPLIAI